MRDIAPYVEQSTPYIEQSTPHLEQLTPCAEQSNVLDPSQETTHNQQFETAVPESVGEALDEPGAERLPGSNEGEGSMVTFGFGDFPLDNPTDTVPGFVRRSSRVSKQPTRYTSGEKH